MSTFGDLRSASRMRELIEHIASKVVDKKRPDTRIGSVQRIDPSRQTAWIYFKGDEENTFVKVRAAQNMTPTKTVESYGTDADIVRVAGKPGSYYIADFVRGVPQDPNRIVTTLVNNPGFELWTGGQPDFWTTFWLSGGSTVTESDDAIQGVRALKFFRPGTGGTSRVASKDFFPTVSPGDVVTMVVWAKKSAASTGAKLDVSIGTKKDGNPGFFDSGTQFQTVTHTLTEDYREYRSSFVVPNGHNRAFFDFNAYTISAGVDIEVWIDSTSSSAVSSASATSVIPGTLVWWPSNVIPAGYLKCDGTVYNIVDYPALAEVLGNSFGGDGVTTFAVPPAVDRMPIVAGVKAVGTTGGSATKSLSIANMPAHTHNMTHDHPTTSGTGGTATTGNFTRQGPTGAVTNNNLVDDFVGNTGSAGSGTDFDVMNPWIAFNFIIKT